MSKKHWYLKVIFHALDICKVNEWLFYCCHCDQLAVPKKDQKSLLAFITELAGALRLAGISNSKSVGRPKNRSSSPTPSVDRKDAVRKPFPAVRYDLHDHFPNFNEKRFRCHYCPSGYSDIYCRKCNMVLCLQKDNNCIYLFHHQL